jgi:hypothetical protein
MQKLTYINLSGEQIVFPFEPFVLEKIGGLGLPDLKIETMRGVYQQGDTVAGYRRERRVVSLTFHIRAESRSMMYAHRMQLLRVLSPDRAVRGDDRAQLIYENDQGKYMTWAMPDGGLDSKTRMLDNQLSVKLDFRCESPYWYDNIESEIAFVYTSGGLTFPFEFPIDFGLRDYEKTATNLGQVDAPVEVQILCKGETPSLYNRTTGKRLSMSTPIPSGYTLILNTDPSRLDARMIDASGNEQSAFGRLSLETPLADFVLVPGINELIYEPGGASAQSEITVTWRNAFEGV